MNTEPTSPKNDDKDSDDNHEGKFEAWESIHNDPDYDPEIHSEPGFPDYPG